MKTTLKRFFMWLWCRRVITDAQLTRLIRFLKLEND